MDPRLLRHQTSWFQTSVQEENQLLEIANDNGFKSVFETTTLPVFWIEFVAEHFKIATTEMKTPLPFATSYLCEGLFFSDSNQN